MGGRLLEDVCKYASLAIAPSTRRSYSAGEKRYLSFCAVCKFDPLPASDSLLSAFATHLTTHVKPGTIKVYLSAVWNLHLELGLRDPTQGTTLLRRVMKGIDRQHGPGSTHSQLLIIVSILRRLVDTVLGSSKPLVDKYMLQAAMLLAFHG